MMKNTIWHSSSPTGLLVLFVTILGTATVLVPTCLALVTYQKHHNLKYLSVSFSSSTKLFNGNFADRMSRYGQLPEDDREQSELSWDWDEEDLPSNDDIFGIPQRNANTNTDSDGGELPSKDIEGANTNTDSDGGELPSKDIEGAQLTEDMKARVKASHNNDFEESSQGGYKFRELMTRANESAADVIPISQQLPSQPGNPMDLSIEEQARLFRELMMERQQQYNQQQQMDTDPNAEQSLTNEYVQEQQQQRMMNNSYQQTLKANSYPYKRDFREYGTGFDGRKIGRNRDADAISTAADVYFAKLKRDSTSRNYARYAGNNEMANEVFWDPSINEIEAPENPYRKEQRELERELLDTAPEEMLLFQEYGKEDEQAAPRVPYKDRLAQVKAKRQMLDSSQQWSSQQQQQQLDWQPEAQQQPNQQSWSPQQEQDSSQQWSSQQQQQLDWQPEAQQQPNQQSRSPQQQHSQSWQPDGQEQARPQAWSPQGWQPQKEQHGHNDSSNDRPPFELY